MMQTLGQYLQSPMVIRTAIAGLMLLYSLYIRRLQNRRGTPFLVWIPVILLIRDILFFALSHTVIILASELVIIYLYYRIYRSFIQAQPLEKPFLIINAVILLTAVTNAVFSFFPEGIWRVDVLVMILNYSMIGIFFFQITEHNTSRPILVKRIRVPLFVGGIVFYALILIPGYSHPLSAALFFPLYYMIPFFIHYQYHRLDDEEKSQKIANLQESLNSVFTFMQKIGNAISEKLDLETVLEDVAQSAMEDVHADGSAIYMVDEFEDILTCRAHKGIFPPPYDVPRKVKTKLENLESNLENTPIQPGETILGQCAASGEPIFIRNSREDERLIQNTKHDALFIQSIIVAPLVVSNRILGVLAVSRREEGSFFAAEDYQHIQTFAEYTALTINNLFIYMELLEKQEMEREVGIAADIQQQLLPSKLPRFPQVDLAAYSLAARGVSGDYYDAITIRKNKKIALVICDVAGKGVPASLVMVMIRTIIYLIAGADRDASTIMTWINKGIAGKIAMDRFATMSFMTYDLESGELEYSNAAHHPLLIYRGKTGQYEELDTQGIPIGLERKTKYEKAGTTLEKGDMIVTYTDGIIEAMDTDNRQYGLEALKEVVQSRQAEGAEAISRAVHQDVQKFVGRAAQHDDQTLMIMKVQE